MDSADGLLVCLPPPRKTTLWGYTVVFFVCFFVTCLILANKKNGKVCTAPFVLLTLILRILHNNYILINTYLLKVTDSYMVNSPWHPPPLLFLFHCRETLLTKVILPARITLRIVFELVITLTPTENKQRPQISYDTA